MSESSTEKRTRALRETAPDRVAITLALDDDVERVSQVSPARARVLSKLHIESVRDLLTHYPHRYIDMSCVQTIGACRTGDMCTIRAQVYEVKHKRPRPRMDIVEITLVDNTSTLIVTAFNQRWLAESITKGMTVAVAGKVEFNYGFKRMVNPHIEALEADEDAAGVIIPVHGATEKISPQMMRRLVSNALELTHGVLDPLPLEIRLSHKLMSRGAALRAIHFPRSMAEAARARVRLAYEELLELEIMLMQEGSARAQGKVPTEHVVNGPHLAQLRDALPYTLTDEQTAAVGEILAELAKPSCANHMLLGDVGTGKTVVAAHALACAADTGGQAVLMAPTEVLAAQHANSLGALFDACGVRWALLCGSTSAADRARILEDAQAGNIDVLIGTHALLEPDVKLARCTLAVIDEQQRFGVDQRARLLEKGTAPDALFLTATPIPRTLALAIYGNLTLSYIHTKPLDIVRAQAGVAPRVTRVHTKQDRGRAYDAALEALARGEQVYVVCPLVGQVKPQPKKDSTAKSEDAQDDYAYASIAIESEDDMAQDNVAAAVEEARFLQQKTFVDYKVELLHGKMPAAEKQAVMDRFARNETQVLVATTVIEVGVDVPNATVMIVEDADRFGLAQLHQLRGRVGRGMAAGEVHLISSSKAETALSRLAAMEKTDDGFELATYDLSLRREGDILGNRQHGASALKLVNVVRDGRLIEAAHADAAALLEQDPLLEEPYHRALAREARINFARAEEVQGG